MKWNFSIYVYISFEKSKLINKFGCKFIGIIYIRKYCKYMFFNDFVIMDVLSVLVVFNSYVFNFFRYVLLWVYLLWIEF